MELLLSNRVDFPFNSVCWHLENGDTTINSNQKIAKPYKSCGKNSSSKID